MLLLFFFLLLVSCSKNELLQKEEQEDKAERIEYQSPLEIEDPIPQTSQPSSDKATKLIGSFETVILDKSKSRVNNIKVASEIINGYVLQPGKVFSFNKVIGKRNAAKGFKKAIIILKGKRAYGRGGGICQVSTTLYNAVEKAGLEILERHSHSKDVNYVPKGKDATVVYKYKDFKFKNTKEYAIKIICAIENDKVKVRIEKVD